MIAIRIYLLASLLLYSLCLAQNIDSLNSVYGQYYETALLKASPDGKYVILNHNNAYGKDEDELFDVKMGKGIILDKHSKYEFVGDDVLLMVNKDHSRFLNLKNGRYKEIFGDYTLTIAERSKQILLYDNNAKSLKLVSHAGDVLWSTDNITKYQLNPATNDLVYISGKQLNVMQLKNLETKAYQLDSNVQWMSQYGKKIYCANVQSANIEFYTFDLQSGQITKQTILSPEAFEFITGLIDYFEVREYEHFILPLYLKNKLHAKEDPELQISYSNRNGNERTLNHHMGIYNIKDRRWDYRPDLQQKLPVYRFLNEKGDFLTYDKSEDVVEEQQNIILDMTLLLDYGKNSYPLPKKRIMEGNYFWDRKTKHFIYFDLDRWMCHHITGEADHELFPLSMKGWENQKNSGLLYTPERDPIKLKGKSAVLLTNHYDYFMVDLETHRSERITNGAENHIKYELMVSRDQYPRSSWTINYAEINLEKEMTFKLLDQLNYNSGFATYLYGNKKRMLYQQGHYKDFVPYSNGIFFTSYFALEPFKLTKLEKDKYTVVYESLKKERAGFKGMKYEIFRYPTDNGKGNSALLFPAEYDPKKKYPMIVNIYQEKSRDILYFMSPYLKTTYGFNYMHYLMNGYIVLMPDLQYEIGKVKNNMITSLEKSIDTAMSMASIDEKNVGVVGLSFGGYETGLALTNSNYFKTGVAGVMISDLVSFSLSYSEFDAMPNYRRGENQQFRMKDMVFENWNGYLENSPIYKMKNINAPVLIWTGSKDKNVSPLQSRMFYLGMKRLQKKAVLLEYVNETHNVFLPSSQLDLNVKIWQWLDHYLKGKRPAAWIDPITK